MKYNFEVRFTYPILTNFGVVFRVERVVCGESDGNMKYVDRQVCFTRIGNKFLAHLSAEKIALPYDVFSLIC